MIKERQLYFRIIFSIRKPYQMKKSIRLIFCLSLFLSKVGNAQTEVTFYTNHGDFAAMMYDSLMPITAGNFLSLVDSNYYDGVIFHRIINNFVIQGGDPTGTGTGGPGYSIPDEFDSTLSNTIKTISMANSGPNTGGSQFFINLRNNSYLDFDKAPLSSKHPVFGIVIRNWTVVWNIAKVAVNSNDRPISPVVMDSVRVTPQGVGLKSHVLKEGLHIYPNPVSENSQVYAHFSTGGKGEMTLISIDGKIQYREAVELRMGNNSLPLRNMNIDKLPPGIYQISIGLGMENYQAKIVIQ